MKDIKKKSLQASGKIAIAALVLLCAGLSGCGKISDSASSGDSSSEPAVSADAEETETPTIYTKTISAEEKYSDSYRSVEIIGLKEYKSVKGKFDADKPSEGNVYLVLFLDIHNYSEERDYINYTCLTAKVDGEEIENTYLVNSPEGYSSILTNIDAGGREGGYIVWEVPEDWESIRITYTGWQYINSVVAKMKLTRDDLFDPAEYDARNFQ